MYVALVYAGILVSMVDSSMRAQPEYRLLNKLNLNRNSDGVHDAACQYIFPVHLQCGAVRQPLGHSRCVNFLMQSLWTASEFACPSPLNCDFTSALRG